jgi:predicted CxxxxCH...CXXCH cytochrome family protein
MRKLSVAALVAAVTAVACGPGADPRSAATRKGQPGATFTVEVRGDAPAFDPATGTTRMIPLGGRVTAAGGLDCGLVAGVATTRCAVDYPWGDPSSPTTVVLSASPDRAAGFAYVGFSGACTGNATCTVVGNADTFVAVRFVRAAQELGSHGNWSDPAVHGAQYIAFLRGAPGSWPCTSCHGQDYGGQGIALSCNACHAAAGFPSWRTDCGFCHGYPPPTGAHRAHFGVTGRSVGAAYGDTRILEDLEPTATPTTASSAYAFGCGSCHPLDPARHMDGTVDVELQGASAPAGSLKALAQPGASYDRASGTCAGVYCHSTGQATPTYRTTLAWEGAVVTPDTRCGQCHGNPPDYAGGNSHVAHVLGMPGRYHNKYPIPSSTPWLQGSFHGEPSQYAGMSNYAGYMPPWNSTPMTCQTCHFDTVDPRNTTLAPDGTPVGYFYLDTGGSQAALCVGCHAVGGRAAPGDGKTLPLRHVNGRRDIHLDPRTGSHDGPAGQSFSDVPWVPTVPGAAAPGVGVRKPPKPYFQTNAYLVNWGCRPGGQDWGGNNNVAYCPPGAVWQPNWFWNDPQDPAINPNWVYCRNYPADCGAPRWEQTWYATISFSLENAVYDRATRTCSNLGCHLGSWTYPQYNAPTWGVRARNCFPCHSNPP